MFRRLKNLLHRNTANADAERDTVRALSAFLDVPLDALPLTSLVPTIAPKEFSETGDWPGPIAALGIDEADLTWVFRRDPNLVRYVTHEMVETWDARGLDWRGQAMNNLTSAAHNHPYSGEFRGDDGGLVMVAMMHDDGLGPSRLLVPQLFSEIFPDGYNVAIPELTCALAFGRVDQEDPRIEQLISGCYSKGTTPVSPLRYRPEQFWQSAD